MPPDDPGDSAGIAPVRAPAQVAVLSDNNRRLRTIIIVDVITAFSATVFMFVIRATVVSSTYLTVAAGMVAAVRSRDGGRAASVASREHVGRAALARRGELVDRDRGRDGRHVLVAADDDGGVAPVRTGRDVHHRPGARGSTSRSRSSSRSQSCSSATCRTSPG